MLGFGCNLFELVFYFMWRQRKLVKYYLQCGGGSGDPLSMDEFSRCIAKKENPFLSSHDVELEGYFKVIEIRNAVEDGFLSSDDSYGETLIWSTNEGRKLLHPLYFCEFFLERFPRVMIIFGALLASPILLSVAKWLYGLIV